MLFRLLRPVRYLIKAVTADRTPKQIALGLALGTLVGLVPKGNLTAGLLAFMMFAIRANLGTGVLTALAISTVSPSFDVLTHGIGLRMLSWDFLRNGIGSIQDAPIVPWLALNNTVVLGSLALGLALFYPIYHLSKPLIEAVGQRIGSALKRKRPQEKDEETVTPPESPINSQPTDVELGNAPVRDADTPKADAA